MRRNTFLRSLLAIPAALLGVEKLRGEETWPGGTVAYGPEEFDVVTPAPLSNYYDDRVRTYRLDLPYTRTTIA